MPLTGEAKRLYNQQHYQKNKEKHLKRKEQYYKDNTEKVLESHKDYYYRKKEERKQQQEEQPKPRVVRVPKSRLQD
jgi:vacuolar-type H+-ATPase subunit F/Vma7